MDFVIGGISGAGATIVTNPMDVVKTRMQLEGELRAHDKHAARYRSIFHAFPVIAKADGVLALQKGLAPAMLLGFVMNSVRLGLYHIAETQGWNRNQNGDISVQKSMLCSSVSGVLSGVAANPASVLKTRMQSASHPSIAVGRQYCYKGMLDGFATIYKTEGMRGYFAGLNATCTRLGVGSAAQLTSFSTMKQWLVDRGYDDRFSVKVSFLASMVSSVLVVIVESPLDVVNTRLLNQGAQHKRLYTGVFDCLSKIYRTEGLHGLYKGLGPLYWRIAPHTTLSLVIWDTLNNFMKNNDVIR